MHPLYPLPRVVIETLPATILLADKELTSNTAAVVGVCATEGVIPVGLASAAYVSYAAPES